MRITRTANAGILLELDGSRILLDGVCGQISPYLATPERVRQTLRQHYPDVVAITHRHGDHCDPAFEAEYEKYTGKTVVDPTFVGSTVQSGAIRVSAVSSRHIGKADCPHVSYVIEGSRCVWFTGDAAPSQWKSKRDLPKPDVLIAPFAYATTEAAWRMTRELDPKAVVLLHLPEKSFDPAGLWTAVEQTVGQTPWVFIPEMEGFVEIDF